MRQSEHKINPFILNRCSKRAMTGEEIDNETLMSLFEAAKWAPSSFNNQPCRFIYSKREDDKFEEFLGLLTDKNKSWAKNSSALIVVISRKYHEYNETPSITHSFEAGAACQNLLIEGTSRNLVTHLMQGFDYGKAAELCKVPLNFKVEVMCSVGIPGDPKQLPVELQKAEKPTPRKLLKDIIMKHAFSEIKS